MSRDDLDELSDRANDAADPPAVAAQLVEAASGTLADPADAAYAYLLAAEIQEQVDDLPQALALVERALAAAGAAAHDLRRARSYRARLLLQLGREDEAAPEEYEQGEEFDDDLADPEAFVAEPDPRPGGGPDLADLDQERYAPYLDPDGSPEADGLLLVWSQEAYEQLDQGWPEVLEPTGVDDWDDYRRFCQALIAGWSRRGWSLALVTGDADGFTEWVTEQGADPYHANLVGLIRRYARHLAELDEPVAVPPRPDDPCWCGSARSYAGCCTTLVS